MYAQASNLKAAYMHLTNYAVNKHNENFVSGATEDSSKWDFGMLRYGLPQSADRKE